MILVRAVTKLLQGVAFFAYFIGQLSLANIDVARHVLSPTHRMKPGIVRIPVRSRTDLEITMLANLISLTPGTLTLEVAPEHDALFIHGLDIKDLETFKASIAKLEDRMLRVLR